MPDRPSHDPDGGEGPDFDWLYGTRHQSTDRPPRRPLEDPEPTQRLPTLDRPLAGGPYQAPPPSRPPQDRRPGDPGGPGTTRRPVSPPPSGPPRRRPRPRLRWVLYLLVLWVVFLVAVPLIAWQRVATVDTTPGGQRPAAQKGTTYLLVGSDSRKGLTKQQKRSLGTGSAAGQRTDTIMLLHTGSGPSLLMSIPRDSLVPIPGHGTTKINAAYAIGGPKLLVRTIEANTGIRVDDYVAIGFAGFVDVVDAVGGVQICPKQAMKDRRANLDIKKGCQDVDGRVALGYARSRHTLGLGDIARAQHQREVVSAVGRKAASPWTVVNPVRYYRLAMAGASSVTVGQDTGMLSFTRFAYAMTRVNGTNGLTCGVPISDLDVHWDPTRSGRLFKLIAEDRTDRVSKQLCRASGLADG
jgi:LCP family protein required for cell wall assembly